MELRPKFKKDPGNWESPEENPDPESASIEEDFTLAARWKAVLLIDECDTYLQKRSDQDARRNNIVSSKFCFEFMDNC
jgi:hypothetical protein